MSGKMVFEKGLGAKPFYVANDGVAIGCLVVKGGLYEADTTTAPVLQTNSGKLTFDLLDDVSVAGLKLYKATLQDNALQTFGSTNAATFHYQGTIDSTFAGAFAGDLALSVEAGKLELTGTSSSSGALSVSADATLSFSGSATASWPKASKVSLTGGTLVLNGNEQLNRRADWHVDAGTLSIPSGKTVTCRNLYKKVNGAWMLQDAGSYTSGFVTGGGTLVVRGGGLVFVVR